MNRKIPEEQHIIKYIPDYDGAGIYALVNIFNGKMYVGSSTNIRQRIIFHDAQLRNGYHNSHFKDALKEGARFTVIILEKFNEPTRFELLKRERYYVGLFNSREDGYNRNPIPKYDLRTILADERKRKYLCTPLKNNASKR